MSNYTDTYWSWTAPGGSEVSLDQFAHGVEELAEGRDTPPPMRGEDDIVGGRVGRLHVPKVADSRVITLTMWLTGQDEVGTVIDEVLWRKAMRDLSAMFYDTETQGTLTKRWRDTVGGTIKVASAMAQYAGGLTWEAPDGAEMMIGRTSIDLRLADPYFYGDVGLFSLATP